MARQLLPTDVELAGLRTIDDVRDWVGLAEVPWLAMSNCLGGVDNLRVLASLPAATLQPAFERARIPARATLPERVLTAVEIIQIGLVWRISRQAYALPDIDPLLPDPATGPRAAAAASASPASIHTTGSPTKRVKMSAAVDQLDESEVDLLDGSEIEQSYRNFREAVGADPLVDADPTVEQITAMHTKVLKRHEAPYADFSVLTPFGRRTQKQAKARTFVLQQDGTWKTVETCGDSWPSNLLSVECLLEDLQNCSSHVEAPCKCYHKDTCNTHCYGCCIGGILQSYCGAEQRISRGLAVDFAS